MNRTITFFVIGLFILCGLITPSSAQEIELSNGSSLDSTVTLDSGSVVDIVQTNRTDIRNRITTTSNTGGNKITNSTGGSITTGDATTSIQITNLTNSNTATTGCCTPTPAAGQSPLPTPQPTSPPSTPPTPSTSSNPSSPGSGTAIGGSAPVLGLSATASDSIETSNLILVLSSLCLFGSAILVRGMLRG